MGNLFKPFRQQTQGTVLLLASIVAAKFIYIHFYGVNTVLFPKLGVGYMVICCVILLEALKNLIYL